MLPALTALLLLAFTPATASTGQTQATLELVDEVTITPPLATIGETESGGFHGPLIIVSSGWKECDLAEFAKAARAIGPYLGITDEEQWEWVDSECRLEADDFRICFDQQERLRSEAIRAFRAQLDKCGWMAESGAFDR